VCFGTFTLARAEKCASALFHLFQVSGAKGGGAQGAAAGTDNQQPLNREAKDVFFFSPYYNRLILMSLLVIALDFILLVHSLSLTRSLLLRVQPTRQSMKISIGWRRSAKERKSVCSLAIENNGVAIDLQAPAAIALTYKLSEATLWKLNMHL
jgi:hypothetical protein